MCPQEVGVGLEVHQGRVLERGLLALEVTLKSENKQLIFIWEDGWWLDFTWKLSGSMTPIESTTTKAR